MSNVDRSEDDEFVTTRAREVLDALRRDDLEQAVRLTRHLAAERDTERDGGAHLATALLYLHMCARHRDEPAARRYLSAAERLCTQRQRDLAGLAVLGHSGLPSRPGSGVGDLPEEAVSLTDFLDALGDIGAAWRHAGGLWAGPVSAGLMWVRYEHTHYALWDWWTQQWVCDDCGTENPAGPPLGSHDCARCAAILTP